MDIIIGTTNYFAFRNDPGLTQSDFTIIFLRDGIPCNDSLTVSEYLSSGLYIVSYTASSLGQDYLELTDLNAKNRTIFENTVVEPTSGVGGGGGISNVIYLTQNYGGPNNLKPFIPNPTSFTLFVFKSSDWLIGNRAVGYSIGQTELDANGNWLTSPIAVVPDTYHIVTINSSSDFYIIKANMQV